MAVINSPQIGIARGKLGDAVYYRSKGNTNARSYNPNTTNRRTVSQQTQRSVFSSAVKFFARGTQNLFVFAFEDKRTQESDYNAFMRYNTKRGIYFGPEQNEDPAYPALGDWVMTHGSLPTIDYEYGDEGFQINLRPVAGMSTITTVGQLSTLLLTYPEWMPGDIFTIVSIGSDAMAGSPTEPVVVGTQEPFWIIRQFIVDESDSTPLDTFGLTYVEEDLSAWLDYSAEYPFSVLRMEAFAVIHSRTQNGKLRVSDSTLIYSTQGVQAISLGRGESWKQIVLASWGSEQLSILQGGIARQGAAPVEIIVSYPYELPATAASISTDAITINRNVSVDDILLHLRVDFDGVGLVTPTYYSNHVRYADSGTTLWELNYFTGAGVTILTPRPNEYASTINSILWI